MKIATAYNIDNGFGPGEYRATFGFPEGITPSNISTPKTLTVAGYGGTLTSYSVDAATHKVTVEFSIFTPATMDNQAQFLPAVIPVGAVLIAIAAVIGLGIIYLSLDKVEKLSESPSIVNFSYVLLIAAGFFLYKSFRNA